MFKIFKAKPTSDELAWALHVCTLSMINQAKESLFKGDSGNRNRIPEYECAYRGIIESCIQLLVDSRLLSIYGKPYFDAAMEALCARCLEDANKEYAKPGVPCVGMASGGGRPQNATDVMRYWGQSAMDSWQDSGPSMGKIVLLREQLINKKIDLGELQSFIAIHRAFLNNQNRY